MSIDIISSFSSNFLNAPVTADELTISIPSSTGSPTQTISGWQSVRLTRSIERPPSHFEISFTEKYPGAQLGSLTPIVQALAPSLLPTSANVIAKPGDSCIVKIGNDLVITGYIDIYRCEIGPDTHTVTIAGRSKCCDIYDCSAGENGINIPNQTILELAKKLCKPFGITAKKLGTWTDQPYPVLDSNATQRVYSIIETVARYDNILVYDDTDGNLLLSSVAVGKMNSGFYQGQNVQHAVVTFSMANRYSKYQALWQAVNTFGSLAPNVSGNSVDEEVKRFRPLIFQSEQNTPQLNIAQKRADYERNVRWGRGQAVHVLCDSWRDATGQLWTPNYLAKVHIPSIRVNNQDWVIGEVTFNRNLQNGTTAELILMPQEAFSIQPLNPLSSIGQLLSNYVPPGTSSSNPLPPGATT